MASPMSFYAAALERQRPIFCCTCITIKRTFSSNKFSCRMDTILSRCLGGETQAGNSRGGPLEIMKRAAKGSNWTLPSGLEKSIDFWTVMS